MRRKASARALVLIAGIAISAVPASADDPVLPNPRLTPGAVAETHTAVICERGYSRAHRVWHDKPGTLSKYGIPYSAGWQYEDDDLVPVCLGGDNASPLNHWPQPNSANPGAADKDRLESEICAEVCQARDDALLAHYQAAFAKDWTAANVIGAVWPRRKKGARWLSAPVCFDRLT